MTLEQYLQARRERTEWEPRPVCPQCRRAAVVCFCEHVVPCRTQTHFVILMHHDEFNRRVATGRMAHLCLENSTLIRGTNFTHNEQVNAMLADPANYPVVLTPGEGSINLTEIPAEQRAGMFPKDRRLTVFILDGTWAQARQIRRLSRNLAAFPKVCFTPPTLSRFLVRKQPKDYCYSTIEAIHHVIDLVEAKALPGRPHDNLLEVFGAMVDRQLDYQMEHVVRISGVRHRAVPPPPRAQK